MEKFILISCIILLTGISFLFALEEFSTEPISLDEFIEEYLPDYTIQKRIPLEGIGRAYAVAKDSGDIVAITEIGEQFKVHFFDIEGNLKWTKEFDKVKGVACEISNNGETIAIHFSNYLGTTNRIFSKEGELLFEKGFMDVWLIPSYDGQYLYERIMGENLIHPDFKLYSKDGSKVNIKGFDDTNVFNIRLKFMKPNKIFAYIEKKRDNELSDYFQLLEIEDQTVKTLWEYEIDVRQGFASRFYPRVKLEDNRIAICAGNAFAKLYIFDFVGNLLYFEDTSYQSFDFLNEDELFLQTYTAKGKYSKLLNLSTEDIRKENIFFGYEKYIKQINKKTYDYDDFDNVLELNNVLLFSIKRHPGSKRKFYTIILDVNDLSHSKNIVHNVDYIPGDNEEYFVFEKYNENPEILILVRGEK